MKKIIFLYCILDFHSENIAKEEDIIKKMPRNDRRLLLYLKRTNHEKYVEFLAKYTFPRQKAL